MQTDRLTGKQTDRSRRTGKQTDRKTNIGPIHTMPDRFSSRSGNLAGIVWTDSTRNGTGFLHRNHYCAKVRSANIDVQRSTIWPITTHYSINLFPKRFPTHWNWNGTKSYPRQDVPRWRSERRTGALTHNLCRSRRFVWEGLSDMVVVPGPKLSGIVWPRPGA